MDEFGNRIRYSENDEIGGSSNYTISKICHEAFLKYLTDKYEVRVSVLRLSNPYGELLPIRRKQGLIGVAVQAILEGRKLNLFSSLDTVRDYISLIDVVDGISCVVASDPSTGFEIYNLSTGIGHSIEEVLKMIEKVFNKNIGVESVEMVSDEKPWSVLNPSKFQKTFSWSPSIDLEEGLVLMRKSL
jgi:UDP-glucose 4-epimerase